MSRTVFGGTLVGSLPYARYVELLLDYAAYAQVRVVMFETMRRWTVNEPPASPYRILVQEIAGSLLSDGVVSLGRLLNGDDRRKDLRDDVSLKVLNERLSRLVTDGTLPAQPFAGLLAAQTQEIKGCAVRENLLWHRNKHHAHLTERYADDPSLLHSDKPLTYSEVVDLSNRVLTMCHAHRGVALAVDEWRVNYTDMYEGA